MNGLMPFWAGPSSKVLILNCAQTYKLGVTCPNLKKSCANSAPLNVTVIGFVDDGCNKSETEQLQ